MEELVRRRLIAVFLIFAPISIALGQTKSEPDALARARRFAGQVVRIIPRHLDGSPAPEGFGLIVGETDNALYIAAPRHLVFGSDPVSTLTSAPDVAFLDHPNTMFEADRLNKASERDDLAVVRVSRPRGPPLPDAAIASSSLLPSNTRVWNIGISQKWAMPDRSGSLGRLDAVDRRLRVNSLRTPLGASGSAAVTEFGVIGMVLEDASDSSLVLPVDRIVEVFKAWTLPVNLLTALSPSLYPEASKTAHLSPSKPNGYCGDLNRMIESASVNFSNIKGEQINALFSRSKIELPGWKNCKMGDLIRNVKYVTCELGPFETMSLAEDMAEEIGADVKSSCLSSRWAISHHRDVWSFIHIQFEPNFDGPTIDVRTMQGDDHSWTLNIDIQTGE